MVNHDDELEVTFNLYSENHELHHLAISDWTLTIPRRQIAAIWILKKNAAELKLCLFQKQMMNISLKRFSDFIL